MNNPVVIAEVVEFLRSGSFDHEMELMDAMETFIELPDIALPDITLPDWTRPQVRPDR
jgi:hypothetical protein